MKGTALSGSEGVSWPKGQNMEGRNLSTLEVKCKETLNGLLRPPLLTAIDPWMRSASPKEKRNLVQVGTVLNGEKLFGSDPAVVNTFGKVTPMKHCYKTMDRAQTDLFRKSCNSREVNNPLKQRRDNYLRHCAAEPCGATVTNYFALNRKRLNSQSYSKLLNKDAQMKLTNWQSNGDHYAEEQRAEMVESLRGVERAVGASPKYVVYSNSPERRNPQRGRTLYDFWKTRRTAEETGIMRSVSTPGLMGGTESDLPDPELANIKKPGGYRVNMTDTTQLQYMKNKQQALACKVVMMGGSGGWETTYQNCFPKYS